MTILEMKDMEEAKIQRFLRWLHEHGATMPSLEIRTQNGWRGVYTNKAIADCQLVFHIPRQLIVTRVLARDALVAHGLMPADAVVSEWGCIAAFLIHSQNENGFFKPYADILPNEFPGLRMFCRQS